MCSYGTTSAIYTLVAMIRDIVPFGLRIPPGLKEMIKKAARKKGQSMNAEMVGRLEASFDPCIDLKTVSTGELVRELIDRNKPGRITIEINPPEEFK